MKIEEIDNSAARQHHDGYIAGYQSVDGNAGVTPSVPPMPTLKAGDKPYDLGFQRGKAKGLIDAG